MVIERWPPAYDAEDLRVTIQDLASTEDLERVLYEQDNDRLAAGGLCCQGDVVEFAQGVPLLDEGCEATVQDDFSHWLVVGNTCDFDRDIKDVRWSQVVPVVELVGVNGQQREDLRRYRPARGFYLPRWSGTEPSDRALVADFLRPCAIDKRAFGAKARRVARLSQKGWFLLHACLIRYLARDDGRFD